MTGIVGAAKRIDRPNASRDSTIGSMAGVWKEYETSRSLVLMLWAFHSCWNMSGWASGPPTT